MCNFYFKFKSLSPLLLASLAFSDVKLNSDTLKYKLCLANKRMKYDSY